MASKITRLGAILFGITAATGLILGAELTIPGRDIVNNVLAKGAIINCTAGNVLRFIPPLIITEEQVDEVVSMIDDVLPKYC